MAVSREEMEELRQDCILAQFNDEQHEKKAHSNLDYLLDHLGLGEIVDKLWEMQKIAKDNGLEVSFEELCDKLKEG